MKRNPPKYLDVSVPFQERVQAFIVSLGQSPEHIGFDNSTIGGVELISVSQDTQNVQFAFEVLPNLCNRSGNLHGGAATAIFDTLTTAALLAIARPGYWDSLGVSRTLTVTFLRPLALGTRVSVDCALVAVGKTMANLKGTMTAGDGKICVTCGHDKVAVERSKL